MICSATEILDAKSKFYSYLKLVNNDFYPALSTKVNLTEYVEKILELANVYVSVENDLIQGMIVFYTNNYKSKISYCALLSVNKNYRGLGISKKLLKIFLETSKKEGMNIAACHTNNPLALEFYIKNGFVKKSWERSEFIDKLDRFYLEKLL